MIKSISFTIVGILLACGVEAKKIDGTIIFRNDTVSVTFNVPFKFLSQTPNYEKLQSKIKFYDSSGKKVKIRPDEAKEISFNHRDENIRMLSRPNTLAYKNIFSTNNNIFLKLEIDGDLKLFKHHFTRTSSQPMPGAGGSTMMVSNSYAVERYILQKGTGQLKQPKELSFRKDMMEYFSDCPALVEKIENRELRARDIKTIVNMYNSSCKKR